MLACMMYMKYFSVDWQVRVRVCEVRVCCYGRVRVKILLLCEAVWEYDVLVNIGIGTY
jgi:hypothetical protein